MHDLSTIEFYEIVIYTLFFLVGVVVNFYLFLRTNKIELVEYFFRVELLLSVWMVAKIFRVVSLSQPEIFIWAVFEYVGIIFVSLEFFAFAYLYKYSRKLSKNWHIGLGVICMINFFMLFTTNFHQLFFVEILKEDTIKGIWFYFHTFYSYSLLLGAIAMIMTSYYSPSYSVKTKIFLTLSFIIPMMVNVVYVFGLVKIPFDLTPIMFNILILTLGIVSFKHNYFDVQLMTRIKILENLYEGIVILDNDARVIEYNARMRVLIKGVITLKKYNKFEEMFESFEDYIEDYDQVADTYYHFLASPISEAKTELNFIRNGERMHILMSLQKSYNEFGEKTGAILKFLDMTEHYNLVKELEDKYTSLESINKTLSENISVKKRLIVEQERNRASKEVHDILGHSVTVVISLLEIMKKTFAEDPEFAKEKVAHAMEATRKGINQLKQSLTRKKETTITTENLIDDLEKLTNEFTHSGVEVEFITNHYPIKVRPGYYDTIYRICQESMTNALRHGMASKITIAVRFSEHSVDIIIADNGKGCEDFQMGNGLKGMEQRVKDLDGFFSCGSPDGEGFNLHVTIPISRDHGNLQVSEED